MRPIHALYLLLGMPLVASGCARTTQAVTQPSELHQLKGKRADGYAIAYDARGRGAYLVKSTTEEKDGATKKRTGMVFCAEPPPDAAANLSADREVNAAVEALVTLKAVEVGVKGTGGARNSASSEIADVATRTELVLLMRDALYRICEMNANGVLSDEKAEDVFRDVLATARALGQRDNVGKLIDVLAIVARTPIDQPAEPGDPTAPAALDRSTMARLIESLVSTIRIIALGDQVMRSKDGTDKIATLLIVEVLLREISASQDASVTAKLLAAVEAQIGGLKDKQATLSAKLEGLKADRTRGGAAQELKAQLEGVTSELTYLEELQKSLKKQQQQQ